MLTIGRVVAMAIVCAASTYLKVNMPGVEDAICIQFKHSAQGPKVRSHRWEDSKRVWKEVVQEVLQRQGESSDAAEASQLFVASGRPPLISTAVRNMCICGNALRFHKVNAFIQDIVLREG